MYKRLKLAKGLFALIDEDDSYLSKFNWYSYKGYVKRASYNENGEYIGHEKLHRVILNISNPNIFIDHKNGNPLDNRKENLRICTPQENAYNQKILKVKKTSKFKGVCLKNNKWIAQINFNNKKIYLGSFKTEDEAAKSYDKASKLYHKEFANNNETNLNIIEDWSIYEVLPRNKCIRNIKTIEVYCSNGKIYKSIQDAAIDLNVTENTIIKACTDNTKIRKVKGFLVKYTGNKFNIKKSYKYTL